MSKVISVKMCWAETTSKTDKSMIGAKVWADSCKAVGLVLAPTIVIFLQ